MESSNNRIRTIVILVLLAAICFGQALGSTSKVAGKMDAKVSYILIITTCSSVFRKDRILVCAQSSVARI